MGFLRAPRQTGEGDGQVDLFNILVFRTNAGGVYGGGIHFRLGCFFKTVKSKCYFFNNFFFVDIPRHGDYGILRAVIFPYKADKIIPFQFVDGLHAPRNGPPKGVARKSQLLRHNRNQIPRGILHHKDFFQYDIPFLFQFPFVEFGTKEHIRQYI
jgi:hypothetical protein